MQSLKIINLGLNESIEFNMQSPYLLSHIEGLGIPNNSFQSAAAPFQDGATLQDSYLESREINVKLTIKANNRDELYNLKRNVFRVINPKTYNSATGKRGELLLYYTNNNKTYRIYARTEFDVDFKARINNIDTAEIAFICQEPYWLDEEDTIAKLKYVEGGFTFPFEFDVSFGMGGSRIAVQNNGDIDTPLYIEYFGPANSPRVINITTGEYIKINTDLQAGEKIIINTADGKQTVDKVDSEGNVTNVFNLIDLSSTLDMKAIVGENVFEYYDDNSDVSAVNIKFSNKYVGV